MAMAVITARPVHMFFLMVVIMAATGAVNMGLFFFMIMVVMVVAVIAMRPVHMPAAKQTGKRSPARANGKGGGKG